MTQLDLMEKVLQSMHMSPRPRFTHDDVSAIHPSGSEALLGLGFLQDCEPLTSVQCTECASACLVEVESVDGPDGGTRGVVAYCPDPGEESHVIWIDPARLRSWSVDPDAFARLVCKWLGLEPFPQTLAPGRVWRLGVFDAGRSSHKAFLAVGLAGEGVSSTDIQALQLALRDSLSPLVILPCREDAALPVEVPDGTEVVSLMSVLKAGSDGVALSRDALTRRLCGRFCDEVLPDPPGLRFLHGYTQVWRLDTLHQLRPKQVVVMKVMHQLWVQGSLPAHQDIILRDIDGSTRIREVFRSRPKAFDDLFRHDGCGHYELNIPDEA